jgi:glycosyltransferase involved in cell wall biosynthesis
MKTIRLEQLPPPPQGKTGWPWTEGAILCDKSDSGGWQLPKISIVTPSFNQGKYVEETIRSVLLQGYPNLEYIVMDGGSTDESLEIFRKYESYFYYFKTGPDGGQSDAIAEGFNNSNGEILAWLNSDDRYQPGALWRIGDYFLKRRSVVFGCGDVNIIDSSGVTTSRIYSIHPNTFLTSNLGLHFWPQPGCFWRRRTYYDVGTLDISLQFCMDRDLFIRLTKKGPSRRVPGPPLADFRVHEEAKSTILLATAEEESRMLIAKYGNVFFKDNTTILLAIWKLWCKQAGIRKRLNQRYGMEL